MCFKYSIPFLALTLIFLFATESMANNTSIISCSTSRSTNNWTIEIEPTYRSNPASHVLKAIITTPNQRVLKKFAPSFLDWEYGGSLKFSDNSGELNIETDFQTHSMNGVLQLNNQNVNLNCRTNKFQRIREFRNSSLNHFANWIKGVAAEGHVGNCNTLQRVKIKNIPGHERYEQTIKQLLYGYHNHVVTVDRLAIRPQNISFAVKNTMGSDELRMSRRSFRELVTRTSTKLESALHSSHSSFLLTGKIENEFAYDYAFLAVLDTANLEAFIYAEGWCE